MVPKGRPCMLASSQTISWHFTLNEGGSSCDDIYGLLRVISVGLVLIRSVFPLFHSFDNGVYLAY
jgi:hypothetical protein